MACGAGGPFPRWYSRAGYTIVRCPHCGLLFQQPQPSDEVLAASYYHDPAFTAALFGELRRRTVELGDQKLRLLRTVVGSRAPGRALDVGCSSGAWLETAGRAGWRAVGVEIGAATSEMARSRGLNVRTGTLDGCADELAADGPFDLITFWDVLEHVRDPGHELAIARSLLAPGGVVAITCPNADGWFPRLSYRLFASRMNVWEYPELPLHLYDFSPRTLGMLLDGTGYRVIASRTFGTAFSHFRGTTLSLSALGGGIRGVAIRGAFELLHLVAYPPARLLSRGNSMLVVAEPDGR